MGLADSAEQPQVNHQKLELDRLQSFTALAKFGGGHCQAVIGRTEAGTECNHGRKLVAAAAERHRARTWIGELMTAVASIGPKLGAERITRHTANICSLASQQRGQGRGRGDGRRVFRCRHVALN